MGDVTKRMKDFLTKSPSVVFPDEVLELFIPVEEENTKLRDDVERMFNANVKKNGEITRLLDENTKLRELIADVHEALKADRAGMFHRLTLASMEEDMRELGIEENE